MIHECGVHYVELSASHSIPGSFCVYYLFFAGYTPSVNLTSFTEATNDQPDMLDDDDADTAEPNCLSYFHGELQDAAADAVLCADGGLKKTGKFLVCAAPAQRSTPDNYMLCVVFKGKVTRHILRLTPNVGWSLNNKQSPYTQLSMLIEYCNKKRKDLLWPVPLMLPANRDMSAQMFSMSALGKLPYFHGDMATAAAAALLQEGKGFQKDGTFLVRFEPGTSSPLFLTVTFKGKCTHHEITAHDGLALNSMKCGLDSVVELISFCAQKQKALRWPVPLLHAVTASTAVSRANEEAQQRAAAAAAAQQVQAKRYAEQERVALDQRLAAEREEAAAIAAKRTQAASASQADGPDGPDGLPYFHGIMAKEQADAVILADNGADVAGKFLLRRDPAQGPTDMILSVVFR